MTPEQNHVFVGHLQEGRLASGFAAARADLAENPNSPHAHVALAHCFLLAGHPHGALDEATAAMALSGNETGCVFLRARAHYILRNFESAHVDAMAVVSQSIAGGADHLLNSGRLLAAAALIELDRTKEAMELLVLTPADAFIDAGRLITRSETIVAAAARFTASFPTHPLSIDPYSVSSNQPHSESVA